MLRVVEVIHGLGRGGAERTIIDRVEGASLPVETVVISTDPRRRQLAGEFLAAGTTLLDLDGVGVSGRGLIEEIEALEPDLVLSHSPRSTIQLNSLRPRTPVPVVPVLHTGPASPRRLLEPLVHRALIRANKHCAGGIALSLAASRGMQATGLPTVRVVPPRIRSATSPTGGAVPPSPWPEDASPRLLFLARMEPEKRPLQVIQAVARIGDELRRSRAHLVMAGAGSELGAARDTVTRLSVADLITFTGEVPSPDALLDACDVLVIASRFEGGPLTLYEAQSRGARILATDVGAVRETLAGDTHHMVIPASAHADLLAAALGEMVANGAPGEAERATRRAAARFRSDSGLADHFYDVAIGIAGLGVAP